MTAPPLPAFLIKVDAAEHRLSTLEDTTSYLETHREQITAEVARGKGYWFTGFPVRTLDEFHRVIQVLNPSLLPYSGAKVQNATDEDIRLYSPTSTPPHLKNFLHNEMAYRRDIPSAITIFCQLPSPFGGQSLVGDQRAVYQSLNPVFRERLERRKLKFVRYLQPRWWLQSFLTRNFDAFALMPSWQANLETDDRAEAQALCEARGFECEWTPKGGLLLSCIIDPCKLHPETGEKMWVNNAHLFQLNRKVYGTALYSLMKLFFWVFRAPKTTCYYGDGQEIEPEVTDDILAATEENEVSLQLKAGDFVYANNHTISHGRRVFRGPRKLYFGVFA